MGHQFIEENMLQLKVLGDNANCLRACVLFPYILEIGIALRVLE